MEPRWCRLLTWLVPKRSEVPRNLSRTGVRWKLPEKLKKIGWMLVKNNYRINLVSNLELDHMNCQTEVNCKWMHMIDNLSLKNFSKIKVLSKSKMIQTSLLKYLVSLVFIKWLSKLFPNQISISAVTSSLTSSPPVVTPCWMASKIDL